MSGLLTKTGSLRSYTTAVTAQGVPKREVDTDTPVLYNLQPDTSQEIVAQAAQRNVSTGKLFLPVTATVSTETMTFLEEDDTEWRLIGLPVKAAGATAQWVSVERRLVR
ncbi:MAG: hypothetical protein AAGB48_01915 [Planctomycetota bacterium]